MFAPKELENEKKVILIYQLPCPWAKARETSEKIRYSIVVLPGRQCQVCSLKHALVHLLDGVSRRGRISPVAPTRVPGVPCVDSYLGYHLQAAQNNRKNENNMEIVEISSPFFALVLFLPWLIEHNLQEGQAAATSGIWRIFFYFGNDKKDDLFPSHRNTQPPRLTVVH